MSMSIGKISALQAVANDVSCSFRHFVITDLFPQGKADMDYFRERSTLLNELDQGGSARRHYQIKVLRKMS